MAAGDGEGIRPGVPSPMFGGCSSLLDERALPCTCDGGAWCATGAPALGMGTSAADGSRRGPPALVLIVPVTGGVDADAVGGNGVYIPLRDGLGAEYVNGRAGIACEAVPAQG